MSADDDLEVLDRRTCLDLLRTVRVGRVAWAAPGGRVEIRPLNFEPDADGVLFRVGAGAVLDAIRRGQLLTFEADALEPALRTGWSVVLVGTGTEVALGSEAGERVDPWVRANRPYLVGLHAEVVSGRRVPLSAGDHRVVRIDEQEPWA